MKYLSLLIFMLITISLTSCDDADDKVTRKYADVTLHAGTKFVLYDRNMQAIDSVEARLMRILPGRITQDSNPKHMGYSINEMGYRFEDHNRLLNMYFNFEDDELVWIGSSTISCKFAFGTMTPTKLKGNDLSLKFEGDEPLEIYGPDNNLIYLMIRGKITFQSR